MFLYRKNLSPSLLVFTLVASTIFSSQCFAATDRALAEYAEIGTAVLRAPAKMAHTYAYTTNDPRQKLAHVLSYTLCIVNDSLSVYNHRGSKSLYHEYTRLAHDLLSGAQAVSSMLNNDVLVDGVSVEEQQRLTQISAALCYVLPLIESAGATYVATTNFGLVPDEDVVKKHQLAAGLTSLAHYLGEYLKTNDNPMIGYARLALIAETTGLMAYQQLSATEQEKFELAIKQCEKTTSEQFKKSMGDAAQQEALRKKIGDLLEKWDKTANLWYEQAPQADKDIVDEFWRNIYAPDAVDYRFGLDNKLQPFLIAYGHITVKEIIAEIQRTCELESFIKDKMATAQNQNLKQYFHNILNEYVVVREFAMDLLLQAQKA